MAVGHHAVTKRAYEQSHERRQRAVRFAEAAVNNTPGLDGLPRAALLLLKAQIERDVLVLMMDFLPEQEK